LDVKSRPSVQQLAAPPTVSFPEKCPVLLKELRHSVKQKNPDTEKVIKIPARNKGRDSPAHLLGKARPPTHATSRASIRNRTVNPQMTQRNADKELIKPICENLRIKENWKQPAWPSGHPLLAMSNTLAFFDLSRQALLC